jgi:hypothetical protein
VVDAVRGVVGGDRRVVVVPRQALVCARHPRLRLAGWLVGCSYVSLSMFSGDGHLMTVSPWASAHPT